MHWRCEHCGQKNLGDSPSCGACDKKSASPERKIAMLVQNMNVNFGVVNNYAAPKRQRRAPVVHLEQVAPRQLMAPETKEGVVRAVNWISLVACLVIGSGILGLLILCAMV